MEKQILASEWKIMEYVWTHPDCTLMQIVKAMKEETGWAKSTVTTMVSRMENKGLLLFAENGGRAKRIGAAVTREEAGTAETKSLLDKIYRGSVGMLVSSLVAQEKLSRKEIEELYDILKKAEEAKDAGNDV
ncbi:MAG: BlaI/MecI/CopY family transcriptional regulator [Clostridia bacterium]